MSPSVEEAPPPRIVPPPAAVRAPTVRAPRRPRPPPSAPPAVRPRPPSCAAPRGPRRPTSPWLLLLALVTSATRPPNRAATTMEHCCRSSSNNGTSLLFRGHQPVVPTVCWRELPACPFGLRILICPNGPAVTPGPAVPGRKQVAGRRVICWAVGMSDHGLRGAELARMFHTEVVGPLLARKLPGFVMRPGGWVRVRMCSGWTMRPAATTTGDAA